VCKSTSPNCKANADQANAFAFIDQNRLESRAVAGDSPVWRSLEQKIRVGRDFRHIEIQLKDPALRAKYTLRHRNGYYSGKK
jgi:hypothetical protein